MDTFEKLRLIRGKNGNSGYTKEQKVFRDLTSDKNLQKEVDDWYALQKEAPKKQNIK